MTNLYVYVLNGTPLTEIEFWHTGQLSGLAPFVASNTAPSGNYLDISSIENWYDFGIRSGKDYLFIWEEIRLLYAATTFASLNDKEKDIVAQLFIATAAERLTLYTVLEQIQLAILHHDRSVKARSNRWEYVYVNIVARLTKTQWQTIANEMISDNLITQYLETGILGTLVGDSVTGIADYIDSNNPYQTGQNGLRNKNYTPAGFANMDTFADAALNIIVNGNY